MDSIFAQTHNYKNSEDSMGVNRLTSPLGTQKFMLIFFDKTVGTLYAGGPKHTQPAQSIATPLDSRLGELP